MNLLILNFLTVDLIASSLSKACHVLLTKSCFISIKFLKIKQNLNIMSSVKHQYIVFLVIINKLYNLFIPLFEKVDTSYLNDDTFYFFSIKCLTISIAIHVFPISVSISSMLHLFTFDVPL